MDIRAEKVRQQSVEEMETESCPTLSRLCHNFDICFKNFSFSKSNDEIVFKSKTQYYRDLGRRSYLNTLVLGRKKFRLQKFRLTNTESCCTQVPTGMHVNVVLFVAACAL